MSRRKLYLAITCGKSVATAIILCLTWVGTAAAQNPPVQHSWLQRLTSENFSVRAEVLSQFTGGYQTGGDPWYSRQSAGFEILKKFSTSTSTVAAFNVQARLVRRDDWLPVQNDMEGMNRAGFFPEYHNIYLDIYNVFNPLLSESAQNRNFGRFNLRVGRFYLPFGINLQTDTHATVMQLTNDRNFGFERDWYAGLYGSITRDLNYDVYYMLGSGYYPRFKGQGLVGARLSLGSRLRNEYGLEGGIAVMAGKRMAHDAVMRSASVAAEASTNYIVRTLRLGVDGRYTHPLSAGSLSYTAELSGGRDESDGVIAGLNQVEFLSRSRKWGWAGQYRHFWQDIPEASAMPARAPGGTDASLAGEFTCYFRNDVTATRLHWLKFHVEKQTKRMVGERAWLFTVQYYLYW